MGANSFQQPDLAFVADAAGVSRVVTLDSSKVDRLAELRASPAFREYRIEWFVGRAAPFPLDAPVAQYFLLRHSELPRSIFDEGDWLAGPFRDAAPADCARDSGFFYWINYGLNDSLIGLLTPVD